MPSEHAGVHHTGTISTVQHVHGGVVYVLARRGASGERCAVAAGKAAAASFKAVLSPMPTCMQPTPGASPRSRWSGRPTRHTAAHSGPQIRWRR
jgi:hypothetical protein